ncbi:kelch-like protein 10 [Dinothrombium tinctorium]|uniref:Kelch-like protein diablo n=1 Tax=Dinothrombium tinctorium TaxID=1965070 RepID=A0A3S3QAV8_9ACAR|nr:kelch-like protein 10 [Dinothrombium tinctorium]
MSNIEKAESIKKINEERIETIVINKKKRGAFDWQLYSDRTKVLKQLKANNRFVDAMLITEDGGSEMVHFPVISTLGKKWTEILYSHKDSQTVEVHDDISGTSTTLAKILVPHIDKHVLKVLVDCAYSGVISADKHAIWKILKIAEEYEMSEVIQACCTYLVYNLNRDNCVNLLQIGLKYHHKLRTAAWNVIKSQFEAIVEQCESFPKLSLEQLEMLLEDDHLCIRSEKSCWLAIKRWTSVDIPGRTQHLPQLLRTLRFARISQEYLSEQIYKDPLLDEPAKSVVQEMIKRLNEESKKMKLDGFGMPVSTTQKHMKPRIPNEVVFAIGGWLEGVPTTLVETYDIRTNKWFQAKTSHHFPRAYHGTQILHGIIYIIGGTNGSDILSTVHCYDPVMDKWYQRANMYEQRCYVSTAILNHEIYAMGGHNGVQRVRTVEKYDHKTNQWRKVEEMNLARSDASAAVYQDKIYIAGGLNDQIIENSVEMYNSEDSTWTFIQPMNSPRTSLLLLSYTDCLYALGGNSGFERLSSVEKYDFKTRNWTYIANMTSRRSTFSGCIIEGKMMVVGGYNGHTPINKVEMYDFSTQQWTEMNSMKYDRSGLSICVTHGLSNNKEFTYLGQKSKSDKHKSTK